MEKIKNISKEIDFNNLTYYFKELNIYPISFVESKGPFHTSKKIKSDDISLQKPLEEHKKLNQI